MVQIISHDLHLNPIEFRQWLQEGGDRRTDGVVALLPHLATFLTEKLRCLRATATGWIDPNEHLKLQITHFMKNMY